MNNQDIAEYVDHNQGFYEVYRSLSENSEDVQKIKDLRPEGGIVTVISEYWCPDCVRNVPRIRKIFEKLSQWQVRVLNRDDAGVIERYNVKRIPTIIFETQEQEELGRIIENPTSKTLEKDIQKILQ